MFSLSSVILSSWYRSGSEQKLQSVLKPGGGRDFATTSVLTINPGKDDDGAQYRCVIWNRALTDSEKMEAVVTLSVNCKDLRDLCRHSITSCYESTVVYF